MTTYKVYDYPTRIVIATFPDRKTACEFCKRLKKQGVYVYLKSERI